MGQITCIVNPTGKKKSERVPHQPAPGVQVDASGTLEAIRSAVATLPQEPVSVRFLHAAAGPVTQADVDLAASTQGIILAFNTRMQVGPWLDSGFRI